MASEGKQIWNSSHPEAYPLPILVVEDLGPLPRHGIMKLSKLEHRRAIRDRASTNVPSISA